jgi:hypothetical protein
MMIFIFILSALTFADPPGRWEFATAIVEKHEFYTNGEVVTKPANSWQSLFAVSYLDSSFRNLKDCVFYRVPGDEPGKIKIKTLTGEKDCNSEILSPGDSEIENISNLRFMTSDNSASVDFLRETKNESWKVSASKEWKKPEPKLLMSSADFKSSRMIYLAPARESVVRLSPLKDGVICHDINLDCEEISRSKCDQCENGWTEIPNGCVNAPKMCGATGCGSKDLPACRRGVVWQRKEVDSDCRMDASFAWCAKGLLVNCDGDKAYCR